MKKIVLFALAACILAACTPKENVNVAPTVKKFYASIEQATRTYTEGGEVYWINEEGLQDEVSIFYRNEENVEYAFAGETGETRGELVPVEDEAVEGELDYIYAFYPYASYIEFWSDSNLLYGYLTPTQYYGDDSFGYYGMNPMAAASETESLEFKNLAGYLKLRLYGDDSVALSRIVVSSNNGEYIAGDILVSIAPGEDPEVECYTSSQYINTSVTVSFDSASQPVYLDSSTPLDVWVCLIPGTIDSGITVQVTSAQATSFVYSSSNPLTIKRGVCSATAPLKVEFPEIEFLGKGTLNDGFLLPLFSMSDVSTDCDNYSLKDYPGQYVVSGYQKALASVLWDDYAEQMDELEGVVWDNTFFAVDATDKNAVQVFGDYGIYCGSYGWAQIDSDPVGVMDDLGNITFPAKMMYVGLSDGWYYGNKNGTFKVTIPVTVPKGAPAAAPAAKSARRSGGMKAFNGEKVRDINVRPLSK